MSVYWPVKFYLIIFKIDWFIFKTKMVSVQLGHSVYVTLESSYSPNVLKLYSVEVNLNPRTRL